MNIQKRSIVLVVLVAGLNCFGQADSLFKAKALQAQQSLAGAVNAKSEPTFVKDTTTNKFIEGSMVTQILIQKEATSYDSAKYAVKCLTEKQIKSFIDKWNSSKNSEPRKYFPSYNIYVCLNDNSKRYFRTGGKFIKEKNDWCYDFNDDTYFDKLYSESKVPAIGLFSIKGTVIDEATKKPASKIKVKLIGADGSVHYSYSNYAGNYAFTEDLIPTAYIITIVDSAYILPTRAFMGGMIYRYKASLADSSNIIRNVIIPLPIK